ncbi:hypothetical protein TWF730_007695 [Orbilia blumenaviensis]|uniref:NB-ARC domain-containing protein n=1 Tax=Orbilia blumenaviensis TaxID=1796055 RepID=A0AAV9V8K6_9PEZI
MRSTFKNIKFFLMVGVGGGVPSSTHDIRLGDIIVSQPSDKCGGVLQYDFGKAKENGEFEMTGLLNAPPPVLLSAVSFMKAMDSVQLSKEIFEAARAMEGKDKTFQYPGQNNDRLFDAEYLHASSGSDSCEACDITHLVRRLERQSTHPHIHYGTIASGNQVIKDGKKRRKMGHETGAICFEMEAAGIMNDFPCIIIRGICDYCDGHKNRIWQPYAAIVAALYGKSLLDKVLTGAAAQELENETNDMNFTIPFRIPYRRNKNFMGREQELESIHQFFTESRANLSGSPSIYAITGTGGMGKTQTAVEYAFRHQTDFTSILWISAATDDSLHSSIIDSMQRIVKAQVKVTGSRTAPDADYKAIALKLGIPGLVDDNGIINSGAGDFEKVRSAMLDWLQLPGNDAWLLIFDNMDDLDITDLQDYLPSHGNGTILITSRRQEFYSLAKQNVLEGLGEESAVRLLLELAYIPYSQDTALLAAQVVKLLGFMPLAISHAGCYIYRSKTPLKEYESRYNDAFLEVQSKKPVFGWDYLNGTAATTWEVSFLAVQKQDQEAAFILLVCSYLNPEEIFIDLLSGVNMDFGQLSKTQVAEKVNLLASYSLVRIIHSDAFSIHPVVHAWTRERQLQAGLLRLQSMKNAIIVLGRACEQESLYQISRHYNLQEVIRATGHVEFLHRHLEPKLPEIFIYSEGELQIAPLRDFLISVSSIGWFLDRLNKSDQSLKWLHQVFSTSQQILGQDDSDTICFAYKIAFVLVGRARLNEALRWAQQAFDDGNRVLGADNRLVIDICEIMATIFMNMRRFDEALAFNWRVLEFHTKHRNYGQDYASMIKVSNSIGDLLFRQKHYEKATWAYQSGLEFCEEILSRDNEYTLMIVHSLGMAYFRQGNHEMARENFQKALKGYERIYGRNLSSAGAANVLYSIALMECAQGEFEESLQTFKRVLTLRERLFGVNSMQSVSVFNGIATVFHVQDQYETAMLWYQKALAGWKVVGGGLGRIREIDTIYYIGLILEQQGKNEDASHWYQHATDLEAKFLGEDHLQRLPALQSLHDFVPKVKMDM